MLWDDFAAENGLICFKYEIVLDEGVFVDVQPSSVCAELAFATVEQDPLPSHFGVLEMEIVLKLYVALYFG